MLRKALGPIADQLNDRPLEFNFYLSMFLALASPAAAFVGKHYYDWLLPLYLTLFSVIGVIGMLSFRQPVLTDRGARVPLPGTKGDPRLNELLLLMYGALRSWTPVQTDDIRITLFAPLTNRLELRQLARVRGGRPSIVSKTRIRMGTGVVGLAYTRQSVCFVPNVQTVGGLQNLLRFLGLTSGEISTHAPRECFIAVPIGGIDESGGPLVIAVIAVDLDVGCQNEAQAEQFEAAATAASRYIGSLLSARVRSSDAD